MCKRLSVKKKNMAIEINSYVKSKLHLSINCGVVLHKVYFISIPMLLSAFSCLPSIEKVSPCSLFTVWTYVQSDTIILLSYWYQTWNICIFMSEWMNLYDKIRCLKLNPSNNRATQKEERLYNPSTKIVNVTNHISTLLNCSKWNWIRRSNMFINTLRCKR